MLTAWAVRLGCDPVELSHHPARLERVLVGREQGDAPRMIEDDLAAIAGIFMRTARRTARKLTD